MSDTKDTNSINGTIDILKIIMALLVVGIHTEPFGFNIWLDRGFGIVTRLCVPFFFVTSAYFYWVKEKGALHYLKRILLLYVIWSLIYLPFDILGLSQMSIGQVLNKYFWIGNGHALWYLCGSVIGFTITYLLLKILKARAVLMIAYVCLIIGCLKSTWAPLLEHVFSVKVSDWLGSRNGLFYAFPYIALGMVVAKSPKEKVNRKIKFFVVGFAISLIALAVESAIFVLIFNTPSTIIWLSVFPCTYFLFMIGKSIDILLDKKQTLFIRKLSTLIYVSQYLFIPFISKYVTTFALFILVVVSTVIFGCVIIKLSECRQLKWLKYLY